MNNWSKLRRLAVNLARNEVTASPRRDLGYDLAEEVLRVLDLYELNDPPTHEGRVGWWTRTRSGGRFYPLDPRPEEVHLEDIWWALSQLCRYNGHCDRFYSVLTHSLMVASIAVDPAVAGELTRAEATRLYRVALLHDATEAYVGDVIRPLKRFLPGYGLVERLVAAAIGVRLDLGRDLVTLPEPVIIADNLALAVEAREICGDPQDWHIPYRDQYTEVVGRYRLVTETAEESRDRAQRWWALMSA